MRLACCSAPNSRPPATKILHTICGNNTSIVSSSWWWAYKCPKHVEQIISATKHSVASSWHSSLRLYYDARRNIHQIPLLYIWITFNWIHNILENVIRDLVLNKTLSVVHSTFLKISAWRWLRRNELKHNSCEIWNIFNNYCVTENLC